MNKEQFDKLASSLYKRGYKKYKQHWHKEDYVIGKSFHKHDNVWEEDRSAYQIILSIYDYSDKDWPNLPPEMRTHVSIEIHIDVSRTVNERVDLVLAWDDTTIEEVEAVAESFYKWVCNTYPEPPKD